MHNFQLDTSLRKEHVRHKPETITGRLMTPILMQVWECPRGGPEPKESAQQSLDQRALAGTAEWQQATITSRPLSVAALPVSSARQFY